LLKNAIDEDPRNAYPHLARAYWAGELWKLSPIRDIRASAERSAKKAIDLDPESTDGYKTLADLFILFGQYSDKKVDKRKFCEFAADNLLQISKRDPTDARLRFYLTEILFQAGNSVEAMRQANEAVRLDNLSTDPTRKLTDQQSQQIRKWFLTTPER
jgi:tetratricopeptide (TPR) repeat protein